MDISTKGSGSGFFADSSLDGLKFGKKIYFEDVGIGVSTKSGGGSSSISTSEGFPVSSPAPAIVRKVRRVTQPGQPPRCQVEGCEVDLSGTKAYYSRHKVCPVHSKFPKVIVAGLEQRFCQQCSRFHQLPEFDQGKRSCRRRLAGHNARRRKPQPGSLLSPRYARLSSSPQGTEDSSRVAGFLMDFSAYPRMPGTDAWPTIRAPNDGPTPTGKFLGQEWQANHPANIYSHGFHQYLQAPSPGGTVHSSSRIPPGECYAGVADSNCALSLLSNQSWDPRNHSSTTLSVNNLVSNEGSPMAQSTTLHGAVMNGFTGNTWNFKNDETGNNLCHNFGLGEVSSSNCHQFPGELELAHQQTNRQYMELPPSRAYDSSSTHQIDWSL